jgi:hypothetical protein
MPLLPDDAELSPLPVIIVPPPLNRTPLFTEGCELSADAPPFAEIGVIVERGLGTDSRGIGNRAEREGVDGVDSGDDKEGARWGLWRLGPSLRAGDSFRFFEGTRG